MLLIRDSGADVSHQQMPTYAQHMSFFGNHPYKGWYIISLKEDSEPIGQIYLTDGSRPGFIGNEIGIQILPRYQGQGFGQRAIARMMMMHGPGRYYANIAPGNERSIDFFCKQGFRLLQLTAVLETH
jgi:RimJ/RimL family protein N-acetyltransferase